jgi:Na+/H+-translocating membrane pyrophosphatase
MAPPYKDQAIHLINVNSIKPFFGPILLLILFPLLMVTMQTHKSNGLILLGAHLITLVVNKFRAMKESLFLSSLHSKL